MRSSNEPQAREFITLLGGTAISWPLAARAQQGDRVRRIGVLLPYAREDSIANSGVAEFLHAFEAFGWTQGRNVEIDFRWADGSFERMQALARELVSLQPDVILASNGAPLG